MHYDSWSLCGTERGVDNHRKRNEPPCRGCRAFMDKPAAPPVNQSTEPPAKKPRKVRTDYSRVDPRPIPECGTESGYTRHLRTGTEVCDPCRAESTRKQRERAQKRRAKLKAQKELELAA